MWDLVNCVQQSESPVVKTVLISENSPYLDNSTGGSEWNVLIDKKKMPKIDTLDALGDEIISILNIL